VVLSQTVAQAEVHLELHRAQHTAVAEEHKSQAAAVEHRAGALHTTELQVFNSKVAIATMKAAVEAAVGMAVAAVLTPQLQTARSWEVGAAEAALVTSLSLQTGTPMLEVELHQVE
jgi:hypothetical protein